MGDLFKMKKSKKKKRIIAAFVGAAVIGTAIWQIFSIKSKAGTKEESETKTAQVTKGTITSSLSSSGVISPKNTYNITSLVEGDVIEADFEEGDQITEGQILYKIDVSSMESELNSANNSLERANSGYEDAVEEYNEVCSDLSNNTYKATRTGYIKNLELEAGDKIAQGTQIADIYNDQTMKLRLPFISSDAAMIAVGSEAVLTLTDSGEQLNAAVTSVSNRDEVMSGGRMIRYISFEVSNPGGLTTAHAANAMVGEYMSAGEAYFEASTDAVMSAEISGSEKLEIESVLVHEGDYITEGTPIFKLNSKDVEKVIKTYKDKVDTAKESIDNAQYKLDTVQDSYENYTITSPISGQVITKSVKTGDTISRNTSSESILAVIYDLSELTFEMSVDELDVRNVKVGQKVEVTADAIEGETFSGTVTSVSLESSQSNGVTNYPVTVTIDENGDLLPGMNVDGVIVLDEVSDTLMIPVDSLMRGNRVYIKDENAEEEAGVPAGFKAVEVETGITSDDYVQIISGLNEGDEVYVDQSSNNTSQMFMQMPGGMMGGSGGGPGGGPGGGRPGGM